jgi:hypothetical protein
MFHPSLLSIKPCAGPTRGQRRQRDLSQRHDGRGCERSHWQGGSLGGAEPTLKTVSALSGVSVIKVIPDVAGRRESRSPLRIVPLI